jgi:hypothetical protein
MKLKSGTAPSVAIKRERQVEVWREAEGVEEEEEEEREGESPIKDKDWTAKFDL